MSKVLIVLLACLVTIAWMWHPGHAPRFDQGEVGYTFRQELAGDAPKGACYRVLVPYLCRGAQAVTPRLLLAELASLAHARPLCEMQLEDDLMPAYVVAGAAALAGYLAVGLAAGWGALLICWAALYQHGNVGDPVTIGAFAVAFWALRAPGRSRWFWGAFAVAALNRETAPLLLLWWLIAGGAVRPAAWAFFAWACLRIILSGVYADNAAEMCWWMLPHNLKSIAPISWGALALVLVAGLLIVRGMDLSPRFVTRALPASLLLLVLAAVLWSQPTRLRVYLELIPMAGYAMQRGLWLLAKESRD